MSNSTFAENYLRNKNEKGFSGGSECIFIGGASVTQYTKKQLDAVIGSLVDATSKLTEGTKQSVASANKSIKGTIFILKNINHSKLSSNEFIADKYSATLVGGVQSNDVFDSDYFTGDNVVDSINYLVDSAMFVGGTSIELTNDLKNTMIMLSIYLSLLNEITKSLDSKSKKLNVETMDLLQRQKQAIMKLLELYNNLKRDMHTDSDDYSTVMKKLYKEGDISKLKERISQTGNKKELLKLLELAAKLERPTLYYSDKLKKAIDDIGGSMAEFEKVKTTPQLEELINKYLLEAKRSGNAKKLKKFKKSIETVRSLMEQKIYGQGETLEVEMEASNEMEGSSEPLYTPIVSLVGANEIESLFDGGEFEELNKEVKLQLSLTDTLTGLSPEKKMFIEENNKLISDMLISAKDAAFEFHKLQKYDDVEILGFLRRLYVLNNIDTDRMDVFYQRGRNYSSNYIRDEFIFGLKDLVLAAKKIENKVPKIKDFYNNVEKYISFLEKWIKITDQQTANLNRFSGGVSCSGVSGSDIYERFESEGDLFYGGIVGMQFSDIIDVFSKSIMVGRMQNGLNLTIDEVKKFSDEQEKVNEKIIGKQINEYLLMMQKYYDNYKEEETFPINKGLFGSVLRDNLNGVKQLLHAAQALDKKIRTYHLKVIENPQAAKDLVQMLSKVVIDLNWITDPDFTELKEFNKYFHIESVAKNKNKYEKTTLTRGQANGDNDKLEMRENVLIGIVTEYNNYKNAYIKEGKDSPFPPYFKNCLMTHVSTLITAVKDTTDVSDIDSIVKKYKNNDNFKANKNVNCYYGKSIFPAKHVIYNASLAAGNLPTMENVDTFNPILGPGGNSINAINNLVTKAPWTIGLPVDIGHLVPIASAVSIPTQIKFLDKNVIGSFYREAQTNLRKGVDSVLMLRNLMSVFDQIDKSYAKDSGTGKTGEKVGKIYASIKEYLVLSAMYPTIYSSDDGKYMAGHIAMRKFGHEIVCPINESDVKFRSTELLGDLQINSLREYSKGYVGDKTWTVGNDNKPFPGFNTNVVGDVDGLAPGIKPDTNYEIRSKCEFVNMFTKCDQLLVMMMKSMFTKIMSVMSMYNVINLQTDATGVLTNSLPYHQLRIIYGGADMNFFNSPPNVIPENAEIYARLFYYMIFYKELFFEERSDNNLIHIIAGARRFALLPVNEGKFTGLMKLFFLKWFNTRFQDNTSVSNTISDVDLATYIRECNVLADSVTGTPKSKAEKIIAELIKDINHRYGLVFTDDIKKLMNEDKKYAYPDESNNKIKYDISKNKKFRTNIIRKPTSILDGENEGLADAASKSKEYGQTILGQATILSANDTETYNLNEHLAAIYNFRKKLDIYTNELDIKFKQFFEQKGTNIGVGTEEFSGLFRFIMMLRYKLETQKNALDRFRILKEYMVTQKDLLVYNVSKDIMIFKELVITPSNLLFKIYVRLISSINLYGRDQIFVDPLLRGTFLYYLDSVNTNLVDVSNVGKAPMIDFSNLENICMQYLEQTKTYFYQLRSGIHENYSGKVEKVINFLYNTHRSLFYENGLISKIEYDDQPNPIAGGNEYPGIRLNPLIDYSEYIHMVEFTGAPVGQNSYAIHENIFNYPQDGSNLISITDPRTFITRDESLTTNKTIYFDLLSKLVAPKNIYVLFEYLLVTMYKMFFEKYGKIYTPLFENFANSLDYFKVNPADFTEELGGDIELFREDMPFSDKIAAVYKVLYKYVDRKETLLENDITKLSKEQIDTMKRNIPLFMFLFKFIVKQSYIQLNMLNNDASYLADSNHELVVNLDAGVGLMGNFARNAEITKIVGGKDLDIILADYKTNYSSKIKPNFDKINKILSTSINENIFKLKEYGTLDFNDIKEGKVGFALGFEKKDNYIVNNTVELSNLKDKYSKQLLDVSKKKKGIDAKPVLDKMIEVEKGIIDKFNIVGDFTSPHIDNYLNTITNDGTFVQLFERAKTFIEHYKKEFKSLKGILYNDISKDPISKRCYLEYLKPRKCELNSKGHEFEIPVRQIIDEIDAVTHPNLGAPTDKFKLVIKGKDDYNKIPGGLNVNQQATNGYAFSNVTTNNNSNFMYQLHMPLTGYSSSPFNLVKEKRFLGLDEDVYDDAFTNIIRMIESFPTSYVPENCKMTHEDNYIYEGLFNDAVQNYILNKPQNDNPDYENFHKYFEKFIEEKINLFFMNDYNKFFQFFFTFIDSRPMQNTTINNIIKNIDNFSNADIRNGAGAGAANVFKPKKTQTISTPTGDSLAEYLESMNNVKQTFNIINGDYGSYASDVGVNINANTNQGFQNSGLFKNWSRMFPYKTIANADNYMPNFLNPTGNEIYNEEYYFGNEMVCINPRYYFIRLIKSFNNPSFGSNNAATGGYKPENSNLIPHGFALNGNASTLVIKNLQSIIINTSSGKVAANGGILAKDGIYKDKFDKNRVLNKKYLKDTDDLDKLYYHMRDIVYFMLSTKGKSLEDVYNTVKLDIKETLLNHYIKGKDFTYLPILKACNTPTLIPFGITFPRKDTNGNKKGGYKSKLMGFNYYDLSDPIQGFNNVDTNSSNLIVYNRIIHYKEIGPNILSENYGTSNSSLLGNLLIGGLNSKYDVLERLYEYISYNCNRFGDNIASSVVETNDPTNKQTQLDGYMKNKTLYKHIAEINTQYTNTSQTKLLRSDSFTGSNAPANRTTTGGVAGPVTTVFTGYKNLNIFNAFDINKDSILSLNDPSYNVFNSLINKDYCFQDSDLINNVIKTLNDRYLKMLLVSCSDKFAFLFMIKLLEILDLIKANKAANDFQNNYIGLIAGNNLYTHRFAAYSENILAGGDHDASIVEADDDANAINAAALPIPIIHNKDSKFNADPNVEHNYNVIARAFVNANDYLKGSITKYVNCFSFQNGFVFNNIHQDYDDLINELYNKILQLSIDNDPMLTDYINNNLKFGAQGNIFILREFINYKSLKFDINGFYTRSINIIGGGSTTPKDMLEANLGSLSNRLQTVFSPAGYNPIDGFTDNPVGLTATLPMNKVVIDEINKMNICSNINSAINLVKNLYSTEAFNNLLLYKFYKDKGNVDLRNIFNYRLLGKQSITGRNYPGDNLNSANIGNDRQNIILYEEKSVNELIKGTSEYLNNYNRLLDKFAFIKNIRGDKERRILGSLGEEFKRNDPNKAVNTVVHVNPTGLNSYEIQVTDYNLYNVFDNSGPINPGGLPSYGALCKECGSDCKKPLIIERAKNAIKYGSIIYKSLTSVFTEIGSIQEYLNTNDYLKDIQSIINVQDTIKPTSIAVDLIPGILNTVSKSGDEVKNIMKSIYDKRVPLGLHTNNIGDLDNLLMGPNNSILTSLMIFLTDDRIHKITLNDFPWLKQLTSGLDRQSDILNFDVSKLGTFMQNFGTLTKYLYEIEMKHNFANMFPMFNSLDVPKFRLKLNVRPTNSFDLGAKHQYPIYGQNRTINDSTISSLPFVLQYNMFGDDNTYFDIIKFYMSNSGNVIPSIFYDEIPLLETDMLNLNELRPLLEMNTNVSSIYKYLTHNNRLSGLNTKTYSNRNSIIKNNIIDNILDIGIFPINIHAMMRELPLANTINNNYSFDIIMKWLGANNRRDLTNTLDMDNTKKQYVNSYLLNPMNQQFVPIHNDNVFGVDQINPIFVSRLNLKNKANSKHIETLVAFKKAAANTTGMCADNADLNYNYSYPADIGNNLSPAFEKYETVVGAIILDDNDDKVIVNNINVGNTNRNASIPFQYYPIAWFNNIDGHLTRGTLYNPDLGLLKFNGNSKLVEKLSGDSLDNTGDANNTSTSYYGSQTMYNRDSSDAHNGVDKDLANPILSVNIYAEVLYNTYRNNVKKFFEEQPNRYNESVIQEGATTLFMPSLVESNTQ